MARRRKGRPVNGVILLDKPLHLSSNQALQKVRGIYAAQKAGHTGALDPLATGMLPICLGESTKFSQYLLDANKTYLTTAKLGVRTTTSDADGEIIAQNSCELVSEQQVHSVLSQFRGAIKQVPTMFSALKYQGKPLYFYARQGIEVPRDARDIHIYRLELLSYEQDEVKLLVQCSKGTYIRTLVDDIGQALGCGAYVSSLHRTQVADYPLDKIVTIEQLQTFRDEINVSEQTDWNLLDSLLLPVDSPVDSLPRLELDSQQSADLKQGQQVKLLGTSSIGLVRVFTDAVFVGVAELTEDGVLQPKRLVNLE